MDYKQLDVLINDAGLSLDLVSRALGGFIGKGNTTLLDAKPLVDAMIAHSGSLQAIQAFSTAGQKPVLPAGMVVADVGDIGNRQGHGPLRVADMTPGNWAAYQQLNLGPIWAQIFADNVSDLNAAIGSRPGDIATAEPDSTPFAPWLGKGQPV